MAIQIRRGTKSAWDSNNSNIVVGEPAITTDTGQFFVGTGSGLYVEFARARNLASEYSTSGSYAVGDVVRYEGSLFQCNTATSGAWTPASWTEITVAELTTGESSDISDLQEDVADLKSDINDALSPISIRTGNLCDGGIIDGYIRSNSGGYIYQWANADYSTGVFAVTAGDYITANFEWANNAYGLFTDDDDAVIANARDDCRQSDLSGYIYKVPTGATKLYFSFNSTALATTYSTYGIVCLVGKDDISTVRQGISTYPYGGTITKKYYADDLNLRSGRTVSSFESDVDGFGFIIRKNMFTAIHEGEYCIAWNVGDSVTTASSANYSYGYADVSGCEKVTLNLSTLSDTFSFFTDKNNKKLSGIADARIGTSRVYAVPEDAKRIYISCQDASIWSEYGMVIFNGEDDIATNPVSATSYPYLVKKEYADNVKLSNGKSLIEIGEGNKVYYVEKDGSGNFTSFVEAITEACKHMDSVVYVGAGTFDLLDELGSTYVSNASSSQMGLVLKNRVHVICSSQTILEMDYDGALSNAKEYLSPINTGDYGCTLENATIIDNNVRYSIHDDRGWAGDIPYTNKFINCTLIHKNGKYGDCIGGGLGENCAIEIRGCYLEGDANIERLAYYHGNNKTGITNAKGRIVVCDNYFANVGSFWVHKYGDSTEMTTAYVSNNSFGSAPQITTGTGAQDNMRMLAWNNEIRN